MESILLTDAARVAVKRDARERVGGLLHLPVKTIVSGILAGVITRMATYDLYRVSAGVVPVVFESYDPSAGEAVVVHQGAKSGGNLRLL